MQIFLPPKKPKISLIFIKNILLRTISSKKTHKWTPDALARSTAPILSKDLEAFENNGLLKHKQKVK